MVHLIYQQGLETLSRKQYALDLATSISIAVNLTRLSHVLPVLCCVQSLSHVGLSSTPWTVVRQAPLSAGILQAGILEGLPCPPPGHLTNPGTESRSPALQANSLPAEPPGKPKNTEVSSLPLLRGIFLTQELNRGLVLCF